MLLFTARPDSASSGLAGTSTLFAGLGNFFIAQRTKRWIDEGLGCCSPGPEP
jgi:hypothetical protein